MADSSDHWEGDLEGTLSDGCGERSKTVGGNARNITSSHTTRTDFSANRCFLRGSPAKVLWTHV